MYMICSVASHVCTTYQELIHMKAQNIKDCFSWLYSKSRTVSHACTTYARMPPWEVLHVLAYVLHGYMISWTTTQGAI